MNDKKKKPFIEPEAEIVSFTDEDIITISVLDGTAGWDNDGDQEGWWGN